jgi:hypothetical protein
MKTQISTSLIPGQSNSIPQADGDCHTTGLPGFARVTAAPMVFIGIDNGFTGAVAAILPDGTSLFEPVHVDDLGKERLLNLEANRALLRRFIAETPQTECDLVRRKKGDRELAQIFTVPELLQIATALPDQETVLALALILFGHLRQDEAQNLRAEHFRRDAKGKPVKIIVTNEIVKRRIGEEMGRTIPIKPNLQKILIALLPQDGPIFKSKDVYSRIRTIVDNIGVGWKRNALRHCCSSYATAAGEELEDVAEWSGHTVPVLKKHYLVPVAQKEAEKYWRITFNSTRIARLPRRYLIPAEKIKRPKKTTAPHDPGEQLRIFPADVLESLAA